MSINISRDLGNLQIRIMENKGFMFDREYGFSIRSIPSDFDGALDLPDGLTEVGPAAGMWCSKLTEVNIPDTAKSVGIDAFFECTNLEKINFGKGLRKIERAACFGCISLENVDLPETLETIEKHVFDGCKSLKRVVAPAKICEQLRGEYGNIFEIIEAEQNTDVGGLKWLNLI